MIIKYYHDMKFISGAHIPNCRSPIDRRTSGLAVNYLNAGQIYFETEKGRREIISAPAVFWIYESRNFKYGPLKDVCWDHFWVHAIGARARQMVELGLFPDSDWPVVKLNPHSIIPDKIIALIEHLKNRDPLIHAECIWQLEGIGLELLQREAAGGRSNTTGLEIEQLSRKISNAPESRYDFVSIARSHGYSYSHFRRVFREHTGCSPRAYQLQCQMKTAADRLAKGSSIKEVSSELGYDNLHYFSRLFKAKIGLAPRHYLDSLPYA
ncbi:MAG: helix-turn-helix domain-containing protein [Victivallales bacterium]